MKHKFNEIWKEKDGSKIVWKLQAEKGILTFSTRKRAVEFQKVFSEA